MKFILFSLLLLLACKSTRDERPPLSKKVQQFSEVYTCYLQIIAADTAQDTQRQKYLDQALAQKDMTREQFYATFEYLKQHPDEISPVLADVQSKLSELEKSGR